MIAALSYQVNSEYRIIIYPSGFYSEIDWQNESDCILGPEYLAYGFSKPSVNGSGILIARGTDGTDIIRITETRRYVIRTERFSDIFVNSPRFRNEKNKFLHCDRDKDTLTFQFVNYLGRTCLYLDNNGEETELKFEVVPDKIGYEDDYIALTEALADRCAEILLDYSGPTSDLYKQSEEDARTLMEQFIFLRKFCFGENIRGLFESIKRNPDRMLVYQDEFKPFGTGIPSRKVLTRPFIYGRGWGKRTASDGTSYFIPEEIAVTHKRDSLDTPANRFIKYALERFDMICSDLIETLRKSGASRQTECLIEAKSVHIMLDEISRDHFFDEIGPLDMMPQNNQVLQKREGYAQIFAAYSMIDMALQLDWRGKDSVYEGESKNVALLYEYWLFFELYIIISSIEGCEKNANTDHPFISIDKSGLTLLLSEGEKSCQPFEIKPAGIKINLYYNRSFSRKSFDGFSYGGSYSRTFRPDYTIAIFPAKYSGRDNGEQEALRYGEVSYIHFDAKYRINDLSGIIGNPDEGDDSGDVLSDEKTASVTNTYKRGDLLKMHTYNDAIRRTAGSFVLYPGTDETGSHGDAEFDLYDEILPGVGAFSIRPSLSVSGENRLKRFITDAIQARTENSSRLSRLKYYEEMILKEPSSQGKALRKKAEQKSGQSDLCVLGFIRSEAADDYYYSLKDNHLLSAGSEFCFYYYAIKDGYVYSHHKNIGAARYFRFYRNDISTTGTYILEPIQCEILSVDLVSRKDLVNCLASQNYLTSEENHRADFYYQMKVRVMEDQISEVTCKISEVNLRNGNDSYSPHSPKVLTMEQLKACQE